MVSTTASKAAKAARATAQVKTIDATGLILGRMSSMVAKILRTGVAVNIVNCEKAVISGNKAFIMLNEYKKRVFGDTLVGPYVPRRPDLFVKRIVRGMMPYKRPTGSMQFKMLKCYVGVPPEFASAQKETFEKANHTRLTRVGYVSVGDVCKRLGGKV